MKRRPVILILPALFSLVLVLTLSSASRAVSVEVFLARLGSLAREAEAEERSVVLGRDGWLFFVPELRHLSLGPFWGEAAREVSRAPVAEDRDPLPAILDVQAQLQAEGIDLLFVPVPAKAALYPDMLGEQGVPEGRLDPHHQDFYAQLEKAGVRTLDLLPVFQAAREEDPRPLYCRQDTHWSAWGCQVAAQAMARAVGPAPWRQKSRLEVEQGRVQIQGDLWRALQEPRPAREWVEVTYVGRPGSDALNPLPWDRESPVLLLGDSHNLVFSAGEDLFAVGAGLPDHLAHELGMALDVVAVRGSGATPSRVNLLRRGKGLEGKKLVIWCLSVREFTEGSGWKKLPLKRPG